MGAFVLLFAGQANAAAFEATASLRPKIQYLNDTAGTTLTFTVKNTGTTTAIKAIEITPPSASWQIAACTGAPAGWVGTLNGQTCLYRGASDSTEMAPGSPRLEFGLQSTTSPGTANVDGDWSVVASSLYDPTAASRKPARPGSAGALTGHIRTFTLTDLGIATGPVSAGAACPALGTSAPASSSQTIVACGSNRASASLTPTSASTLTGSMIGTAGTFASTSIASMTASDPPVVLGTWAATLITSNEGSGKKISAQIVAAATQTSPVKTAKGFTATAAVTNTAPVAQAQSPSTDEDTALPLTLTGTDADDDNLTFSIVVAPTHGSLGSLEAPDCSAVNTCTSGVTYTPSSNYNGADSFTFKVNDGTVDSPAATVSLTINAVNDAPVAAGDAFDALGNTRLIVGSGGSGPRIVTSGDVLSNDTDVDTASGLTVTAATSSSANCAACNNVVMAADGTFTYDPPPGYLGSDTFTYTVNDNDTGDSPSPAQNSTGTVTITVQGPLVWYVDSTPGALTGDTGRSHSPFTSIASLAPSDGSVDTSGDVIFVYSGTYSAAGGLPLQTNQQLLGEPEGLTVDPTGALPSTALVTAGGTNPVLSANATSNTAGITLASGVSVKRIDASNSTCSGCSGVRGTSITTADIGPNTQISGNAGGGVLLSGGNGAVNIQSAITSPTGLAVSVASRTGGTVSFPGAISATGSAGGISLTGNTGATINFTGGVAIASTTGNGFAATGGGTVTATQNNSSIVNTIATTTGTALNVQNTTIGAAGLAFRSISANGAANGIVLNATGSAGGLTVSANGGTCSTTPGTCTGGEILSTTGAGVRLLSTKDVSLDRMRIASTADSGVQGTGVTNFTLTNSVFQNNGNANLESALAFNDSDASGAQNGLGNNVAGTFTVTDNVISSPFSSGVDVQSDAGTISNAVITGNAVSNPGANGIDIIGNGTASGVFALTKGAIQNNTVTNAGSDGIELSVGNASGTGPGATAGVFGSATDIVTISGNAVTMATNGAQAIALSTLGANSASRSQMNYLVTNNGTLADPILGSSVGTTVLVGNNGYANMSGTISNNVIDANHTANLGGGNGIGGGNGAGSAGSASTPHLRLSVDSNTISGSDGNGILLVGRGASGIADLSVTNNSVTAPINSGGSARQGIRVDAGNSLSVDDAVCLAISGNSSAGSNGASGIGLRKQGTTSATNDFALSGIPQATPTTTDVVNYVNAQNASGGGTDIISGDNYAQCTFPSAG